ncbi:MAG: DAK2 domain-containing protein [Ruminococcaceae bacterium]|nr:DAK2 domain-containing protein [Oscillospiraceae bacterium]
MLNKIEGSSYIDLLCSGIKNLDRHRSVLNDLNVFPVPDGDTGTNMVMTLKYGYESIKNQNASLAEISKRFSSAAVYGARGNSGVIVSQFFKGISEVLEGVEEADSQVFSQALDNGCKYAYASVANPVEGTMLTVIKDASTAVIESLPLKDIQEVVDTFLLKARTSLENTPELLPILKKAGVVDSGGSGIVYFFEGVQKYLKGEAIEEKEEETVSEYIDLSRFNKDTVFEYGYCVEGLLQLKIETEEFNISSFTSALTQIGESVVTSLEGDKVKLHVHVKALAPLMEQCQKYGELLTVKIDNMTVQNLQRDGESKEEQRFLYDKQRDSADFSVIAVASNSKMQKMLFEMGADVVILSEIAPSSQDFLDAFNYASSDKILVFPNSSNSILSAKQASKLYKDAKVVVLNSRSLAECYASLSVMDYEGGLECAAEMSNQTISDIYQLSIYRAARDRTFGRKRILQNDFFALSNNQILDVGITLEDVTLRAVKGALEKSEYCVLTLFYGKSTAPETVEWLKEKIMGFGYEIEVATVSTFETIYDLTVTFE